MRRAVIVALVCACAGCATVVDAERTPGEPTPTVAVSASGPVVASPSPQPAPTPTGTPAPTVTPSAPVTPPTEDSWGEADMSAPIPLVSKRWRLPASYVPQQTGAWGLTADADAAMRELIKAARADGVKMQVRSGYRSFETQKATYERALRTYSSEAEAKRYNAPPGASEHQTGLAADMWDGKNRGYAFRGTPTDKWLAENAYAFGFIIRYPKGKEHITGYADEPWHLRYVGAEAAKAFAADNSLTLEEYLGVS